METIGKDQIIGMITTPMILVIMIGITLMMMTGRGVMEDIPILLHSLQKNNKFQGG